MFNRHTLKTCLAACALPALLAIGGCSSTGDLDVVFWDPVARSYSDYLGNTVKNHEEAVEHNSKLLHSEGLQQVGEMNQGVVVKKNDGSNGYWVRDNKSHNLYPVKQSGGVWIMTMEGLGQRSLDKDNEPDKKKNQPSFDPDGEEGGEGGGEGGGGD